MSHPHERRHRRRLLLLGAGVVLGVLVVVTAVTAWQGWTALRSAQQTQADLGSFRKRLLDRDIAGADAALAAAQSSSDSARRSIDGPIWSVLAGAPKIGDDITAARQLSVTVDDVTQGALPAVMTALSFVDPSRIGLQDGRVPVEPLREASEQLSRAAGLLRDADADAGRIDGSRLSATLATQVVDVQQQLDRTARLASRAAVAGELLPGMLGADGTREYLLVAQNNAEQRSLGGIVGALALVRAEEGELTLVRQAAFPDIGSFERPVLPLSDAEVALYGTQLGRYPQNPPDTPDFPRAAQLLTAMWQDRIGGQVDGVVSIDPWALQLVLGVVGPVPSDIGPITGDDAARRLMYDVYAEIDDPARQNAVFADVSRRAFDKVAAYRGDAAPLTRAFAEGADEGRILVWSSRRAEERLLRGLRLGGTLEDPTPGTPRVGVYLHDSTASKMGTFQRVQVRVRPAECGAARSARVSVTLRSVAPADRDLPAYVTGTPDEGPPGDTFTQLVVYAPPGWTFARAEASDGRDDLLTYRHDGLWAATRDFALPPGARRTLDLTLEGPKTAGEWEIRYTPGTAPDNVRTAVPGCTQ